MFSFETVPNLAKIKKGFKTLIVFKMRSLVNINDERVSTSEFH
jgi:hypothetical protein